LLMVNWKERVAVDRISFLGVLNKFGGTVVFSRLLELEQYGTR